MQQQEQFGRDEDDKKLEESRNWPRGLVISSPGASIMYSSGYMDRTSKDK